MSPYYLEATQFDLCHHSISQFSSASPLSSSKYLSPQSSVLFIIIVCNRNIRRATVLSLIFIPEEGIRSPFLSALKMFTHEHHTVPYFFLQRSQGQKRFYLLQRTYTTHLCSCNFHRTTVTRLSCSCYRYAVNILVCSENALKINIYSVNIENILGERKKSHIVLNSVEVDGNGPGI